MKIIDLLNRIANGEEVPRKIEYRDKKFVYDKDNQLYIVENYNEYNDLLMELSNHKGTDLNYEVEIIEEEKKIPEKFKVHSLGDKDENGNFVSSPFPTDKEFMNKINEIIDYLDYRKNKGDE